MERVKIGFVFNLVMLFLAIDGGNCLKCYTCPSGINSVCSDPYKPSDAQLVECSSEVAMNVNSEVTKVLKRFGVTNGLETLVPPLPPFNVPLVCQKLTLQYNGEKSIVRGCQIDTVEDKTSCRGFEHIAGKDRVLSCDVCKTDSCNGVGYTKAPALLGLIGLVSSVLILTRG